MRPERNRSQAVPFVDQLFDRHPIKPNALLPRKIQQFSNRFFLTFFASGAGRFMSPICKNFQGPLHDFLRRLEVPSLQLFLNDLFPVRQSN